MHQRADLFGKESGELVEALEFLAVALGEFRLEVPGVDVAGAAVDEEPDHPLDLRIEMGRARLHGIERSVRSGRGHKPPFVGEHSRKSQHSETHSATLEHRTARECRRDVIFCGLHGGHRMYRNSFKLIKDWQ